MLRPVAAELAACAAELSVEVTGAIGQRLGDLLPDPESFEANRASTEASILGFAQILEQGADPAATSLGTATLAYTKEAAQRGIPLTTLMRSYRLGLENDLPVFTAQWRPEEEFRIGDFVVLLCEIPPGGTVSKLLTGTGHRKDGPLLALS